MLKKNAQRFWLAGLFAVALLPRIFGLDRFLTTDESYFVAHAGADVARAFLRGDFRETYWHFYPGVTMSWADGLGLAVQWMLARLTGATELPFTRFVDADIRSLMVAARLPVALLTALFVPATYLLLRRRLDRAGTSRTAHRLSVAAALLIAFDPFFVAHSRVAHGDAPVTVFMTLSMLALLLYLRDGGRKMLIFSAVTGSLAALTKAPGQFIAPMVVLAAAVDWLLVARRQKRPDWRLAKRRLFDVALWGGIALLTMIVLWPSMWVDPLGTVTQMISETFGKVDEGHLVYFMGQPVLKPGIEFYLYVIPFRLTPLTSIGMILSLGWLIYRFAGKNRGQKSSLDSLALCLWGLILVLLLAGALSPKKQDRYLLPLFPLLDILAVIGWYGLLQITIDELRITNYVLRSKKQRALALQLSLAIVVLAQGIIVFLWHPYQLAYFNPLMGGLSRAVETTLVGWGEGMEQVAAYLNRKPNAKDLYVASTPSQTLLPYFAGTGENFYTNDIALRADYVVIYRAQQQRLAPSPEIVREYLSREPETVIKIKGVPYAWVYPNTPLIFADVPDWGMLANIGFGDAMRLAGYHLEPQKNSLGVDLFWHALPAIETATGPCVEQTVEYFTATVCPRLDYTISVRLVSAAGDVVAQHDSPPANGLLPTSQWRVDDYVQDHHTLSLPADLPSGEYTLSVVVYQSDTGAVLAGPVEFSPFLY